ncbi:cytochrome P450 [Actinokineospora sp. NBRC 105648]|uniref:cytochrome P450 n=1 Tax=Actinokineospora sp. NBRC 105648 TaxID=3032206 RepID=UPI0024A53819|nr:cytochrome P450 [Actinokineospora sp. NBRC 105648]GLZ39709.1 cytochrome P450 [Actinokineospora sp. NBRC 105648]
MTSTTDTTAPTNSTGGTAPVDTGATTGQTDEQARDRASLLPRLPAELTDHGKCPFDPPAGLTELSAEAPIHRVVTRDGDPAWLVTGHAAARAVLADPRMSSDRMRRPGVLEKLSPAMRERVLDEKARAGGFIAMDAPEHTRYRKLLTGQFTVRRMRQLGPRINQIVTDHLDAVLAQGPPVDLVTAFALPVPSLVICELLGVPYADRAGFQSWTAKLLTLGTPLEKLFEIGDQLRDFMLALVADKRARPADDLLSGLIQSGTEPALTDHELVNIANLLLIAGHETTANMLALGTFGLLDNPEQLAALRADPSGVEAAVEELLRYLPIIHLGLMRHALADVEVGGQRIAEGDLVLVSIQAANRDGAHYADPDALDLTRARGPHLSFGHGIHQCLGQQLARVELAVGFTELLRRLPGLRLAVPQDEVPLREDMAIYGVHSLPVTWDV